MTTTWTAIVTAAPTPGTRTITFDYGNTRPSHDPPIGARLRIELINEDNDNER